MKHDEIKAMSVVYHISILYFYARFAQKGFKVKFTYYT